MQEGKTLTMAATREEKNHQAYMDVLECTGPSLPGDDEYMECYRFWFPLSYEYQIQEMDARDLFDYGG